MSYKTSRDSDVTLKVLGNDLCIGCGMCAGICPRKCLQMQWSNRGELIPVKVGNCATSCGLCLRVCPFFGNGVEIDTLAEDYYGQVSKVRYHSVAGYYKQCYAGYSLRQNQRLSGASGGMLTWCLETLLENGNVDAVITVIADEDSESDRLFRFAVLSDIQNIQRAARSKYYPVEISSVIQEIIHKRKGNYALVGLPCLIYGIRKAMKETPILRKTIKYTFSLVCGQMPNRFYTESLALESGINVNEIKEVDYRIKEGTESAGNFFFRATAKDNTFGKPVPWSGAPWHLWSNGYFIQRACRFCDDVFGETADAVFMDAWLPEYSPDPRGHSLVIVRSSEIHDLLEIGINEKNCELYPVAVEDVVRSQEGVIVKKKHLIKGRLYLAGKKNRWIPKRRTPSSALVYFWNIWKIYVDSWVIEESKRLWPQFQDNDDTSEFISAMALWERKIRILNFCEVIMAKVRKVFKDPFGVIKRAISKLVD